jgi:hypothetical protein
MVPNGTIASNEKHSQFRAFAFDEFVESRRDRIGSSQREL